jgi:transglycosylase-like protein with SLT domain
MARHIRESISTGIARSRRKAEKSRTLRMLVSRAVATVTLGAALSIGGATEALQGVHFLVQKDLDSVSVVKSDSHGAEVVANLQDGFAANSLFKLTRVLPDSVVSHKIALFNDNWLPQSAPATSKRTDLFHTEMARINEAIRRDFFSNAVPFGDLIHEKAQKYDVDPALVAAVVETESRFHPQARSAVGARGLMQLMPRTGRWLGATDLYDPEQNVDAGVRYLKYLQDRFDGNLKNAIAAYNGGEGNVERYGGVPPFQETRSYVKKVLSRYQERQRQLKQYERDLPASAAAEGVATLR